VAPEAKHFFQACAETVVNAIQWALEMQSTFNTNAPEIAVELNKIQLNGVFIHPVRRPVNHPRIISDDNHSMSLTNINAVHYFPVADCWCVT